VGGVAGGGARGAGALRPSGPSARRAGRGRDRWRADGGSFVATPRYG